MAITGVIKEQQTTNFTKKVGLFEAEVVAINPTAEEYKSILDIELKEDSKATDYLSVSQSGVAKARLDVWLKDVKTGELFKSVFFLDDEVKVNRDGSKTQFINSIGRSTWAASEEGLPSWFVQNRSVRKAKVGEEELYSFLSIWLSKLNFRDADTELELDWKKLMRGNVSELKEQIGGDLCKNVVALATIKTVEKEEGPVSYQGIYKRFMLEGSLKYFRNMDYNSQETIRSLEFKDKRELKLHEKFVVDLYGDYGCREFFSLSELHNYDPESNLAESDKVLDSDDSIF